MPAGALARILERQPRVWTSALVEQALCEAFSLLPGRSFRVSMGRLEPDIASQFALTSMIDWSPVCVPDRRDREILLYWCRRSATRTGMSHQEAARYYGMTRKGLSGAKKRAAKRYADCLNERGVFPMHLVGQTISMQTEVALEQA